MIRALLAIGAAATAFVGSQASAATYVFEYTLPTGNVLTGVLKGTLAPDGNTFAITGLNAFRVNGVATDATMVISTDALYGLGTARPSLTVDGSLLDFGIFNADQSTGAVFAVGNRFSTTYFTGAGANREYGGDDTVQPFEPALYLGEITFAGAGVPEPAAWALMIGGFGMVGGTLRRRKVTARVAFA